MTNQAGRITLRNDHWYSQSNNITHLPDFPSCSVFIGL